MSATDEQQALIEQVQKAFPLAYCTGCDAKRGFCIVWPNDITPIVATGSHPKKAWHNAFKLIKGKNKKSLEALRQRLLIKDTKKGSYGPGA